MTPEALLQAAETARQNSYCPYSHFAVGAALCCDDGRVFDGCNIENAAFSPTICAERTAVAKAVSAGARRITAVAVVGGKVGENGKFCTPCGVCRQVLAEFATPDTPVYTRSKDGGVFATTLGELLPLGFSAADMEG